MKYKTFRHALFKYNFIHYGYGSARYLKKELELHDNSPVNVVQILKFSYEEFGLKKTIITNLILFLGMCFILGGLDVLSFYVSETLYSSMLHFVPFVLLLRKFDVLFTRGKHQTLLFFYLCFVFIFQFYWLLSFLFIIIYENMVAITTLKGGLYS